MNHKAQPTQCHPNGTIFNWFAIKLPRKCFVYGSHDTVANRIQSSKGGVSVDVNIQRSNDTELFVYLSH